MLEFKEIQVTQTRACKITCNKCGRVVDFGDHDFQTEVDFTTIKNTYRFGSSKDGDKYVSHICEPCMDEFYATFVIPPQVVGMSEWGTEPADPIVIASQPSETDKGISPVEQYLNALDLLREGRRSPRWKAEDDRPLLAHLGGLYAKLNDIEQERVEAQGWRGWPNEYDTRIVQDCQK